MVKVCKATLALQIVSVPASRGHTRFQTTQFTRFENDRAIDLWRHKNNSLLSGTTL